MKHSQVRLWRGPMFQDVAYGTSITVAKRELDYRIMNGTRYITLTGEIWGAFYEDFEGNWRHCTVYCNINDVKILYTSILRTNYIDI